MGTVFRGRIHLGSLQKGEKFLNKFDLADTLPHQRESSTIDILVGNNFYLLVLSQKVEVQLGLYLLESNLRWLLSGRTYDNVIKRQDSSMLVLTYGTDIERDIFTSADKSVHVKTNLDNFWNLETIGINDSTVDPQDTEALKVFHETLHYEEGRYHVSWLWKNEITRLPENR